LSLTIPEDPLLFNVLTNAYNACAILDEYDECEVQVMSVGYHNHPSSEDKNHGEIIARRIVHKCQENPSVPAKRVYDEVCDNLSSDSDDAPTFR